MNKHLLNKARVFEAMQEMQISEQERPAFHVTGTTGWINDPNGFSYYKNEYIPTEYIYPKELDKPSELNYIIVDDQIIFTTIF